MTTLYIAWQDADIRSWYTVGMLERENDAYRFQYTAGALDLPGFTPFGRMRNLYDVYYSRELFPLFANRILNKSRPEYRRYLEWLDVGDNDDALLLLSRSGGARATDLLEIFEKPQRDDMGFYTLYFFSHGLRYLSDASRQYIDSLQQGDTLELVPEPDNDYDESAIALHGKQYIKTGYCPRYFLRDLHQARKENAEFSLEVAKVNKDAVLQMRLLCKLRLKTSFDLFSGEEFTPVAEFQRSTSEW
jgi:hypothetical protein